MVMSCSTYTIVDSGRQIRRTARDHPPDHSLAAIAHQQSAWSIVVDGSGNLRHRRAAITEHLQNAVNCFLAKFSIRNYSCEAHRVKQP
jgi:hypothetical protein